MITKDQEFERLVRLCLEKGVEPRRCCVRKEHASVLEWARHLEFLRCGYAADEGRASYGPNGFVTAQAGGD